jgi:hypothetical protein
MTFPQNLSVHRVRSFQSSEYPELKGQNIRGFHKFKKHQIPNFRISRIERSEYLWLSKIHKIPNSEITKFRISKFRISWMLLPDVPKVQVTLPATRITSDFSNSNLRARVLSNQISVDN